MEIIKTLIVVITVISILQSCYENELRDWPNCLPQQQAVGPNSVLGSRSWARLKSDLLKQVLSAVLYQLSRLGWGPPVSQLPRQAHLGCLAGPARKDPLPSTTLSHSGGRGQECWRVLLPQQLQSGQHRLQQKGILSSPSSLLSIGATFLTTPAQTCPSAQAWRVCPSQPKGPAPSTRGADVSSASQHLPCLLPGAYLAVTTQVISIVQPLALGEGELVPPLHEVTQSCVHLAIIDTA